MKAVNAMGVTKTYGRNTALRELSLSVEEGEIVGVFGAAGSGKTTLLRILAGLTAPTKGQCFLYDRSVRDVKTIHTLCGVVTKTAALYDHLNGLDNLTFFASLWELDPIDSRIRASSLMKRLGIWDKREIPVSDYSDGERIRLSFARALLHSPMLLLYDMDTEMIDGESERLILDTVAQQNRERGMTVCAFSRKIDTLKEFCTGYALLNEGRMVATGSYEYLRNLSALRLVCRVRCNKKPVGFRVCDEFIEKEIGSENEVPGLIRSLIGEGADIFEVSVRYPDLSAIGEEIIRRGGENLEEN